MKLREAKSLIIASAIKTYAEKWLRDLVRDHSCTGANLAISDDSDLRIRQCELLEAIVCLLPSEKAAVPINFLCCLLRSATFIKASSSRACKTELEKRISTILEHVTINNLLVLSFTYDGERLFDLESVRKIIFESVEKEKSV